jgi:glycosyltransferase involved in cell wall biosynthesis
MAANTSVEQGSREAPVAFPPQAATTLLSVITPAFNESDNLPVLYLRLARVLDGAGICWEWIVVDDHSRDNTFEVISRLARSDSRVRGLRFARNFGSHTALACGLHHARGNCAAVMAADLQDPPESLPALLEEWRAGAHVVWAVRQRREGESATTVGLARIYYWLMRHMAGMKEMPSTGADFFLADRKVIEAFREFRESNTSVTALITWLGFKQSRVLYDKQARLYGRSGWSLEKKVKLLLDSITSFSYVPVRVMSYVGLLVALAGFIYAGLILVNATVGKPVHGWSSLMVAVLVIGGCQILMMGVLGEYLWRALEESRGRPRYLIEQQTGEPGVSQAMKGATQCGSDCINGLH